MPEPTKPGADLQADDSISNSISRFIRTLPFMRERKLVTFDEVQKAENDEIKQRRGQDRKVKPFKEFGNPPEGSADDCKPVLDTVGLALSGGGIRSAAFSLGVIQSLQVAGVIKNIDYLSTVSGGGYIGCSMSAGMSLNNGDIPFPSEIRPDESPTLQHIRDYSNYLIPHGTKDVVRSGAIYLRGLAANALQVGPVLLLAAAVTIYFSPTRALLSDPVIVRKIWSLFGTFPSQLEHTYFLLPILAAIIFALALALWAIIRARRWRTHAPEIPGIAPSLFSIFLVVVAALFFLGLQPFVIASMFAAHDAAQAAKAAAQGAAQQTQAVASHGQLVEWFQYLVVALAPIAGAIAFAGNKLESLINRTTESSTWTTKAISLASRLAIYLAALVIPLLLWIAYLELCYWAIPNNKGVYAAPGWLTTIAIHFYAYVPSWASWPGNTLASVQGASLLAFYCWLGVALVVATLLLKPNANSLHRLYRDRLSTAFLVKPIAKLTNRDDEIPTIDDFKLSELDSSQAPYHLINTALNLQASKSANRRGRNADFFLFSKRYIGSETTSYVDTELMQDASKQVDLATAMAISGAAASSNMGTNSIKAWTMSLALLNVRLGYWLLNPKLLVEWVVRPLDIFPYFLLEMFGRLNENRKYVYLTDGGHVENLGLYELLRRRCCLIIVVDGEADPEMHFSSLVRLERYARIDLGIRIELPLESIRAATFATSKEIKERGDAGELITKAGPHCAIGRILYPGGEGRILYVKTSMTGDESSYVTDYKRRHASFPHETTGDQFFTEEQFEVYRVLGFHIIQGLFDRDRDDRIAIVRKPPLSPDKEFETPGRTADETAALAQILGVLRRAPATASKAASATGRAPEPQPADATNP